ncbi:hypothetical protein BpHYR1_003870 [Brachionus plicatilis]|uniref:Uncharacterized protein n=1 Tax=Brachionus plicatilis TaxID=10195 RepID=A0A3M7PHI5_BRAPC|nr:hypothetical protein BpHYR1_003870 [Brachionus plicatilis]
MALIRLGCVTIMLHSEPLCSLKYHSSMYWDSVGWRPLLAGRDKSKKKILLRCLKIKYKGTKKYFNYQNKFNGVRGRALNFISKNLSR